MSDVRYAGDTTVSIRKGFKSLQAARTFQAELSNPEKFYITRIVEQVEFPDRAQIGFILEEVKLHVNE